MHSNSLNTNQMMRQVIYALALGVAAAYTFFGWGVILQIVLAVVTAVVIESAFLSLRKLPVKPAISDGSAVLSAVLLAISIPSIAPWWIVVVGTAFAIIFGKQLYGGLGNNPFNPAMLGYAFLLISYPLQMTTWTGEFLNLSQAMSTIFNLTSIDALSGATQLDEVKTQLALGKVISELEVYSISQAWINAGFLLGGLYLIVRKIITWHIPVAFIAGMVVISSMLYLIDNQIYMPMQNHLMLGATMLGAFFIATDPVSASTTPSGRLIYGFLIGVLVVVIRVFGGYPDGVAFAVLLM
ncbi:MAG: RnfABCDGE type electron transport complex subunit D, partial [Gammaproteobacteria bacterium]